MNERDMPRGIGWGTPRTRKPRAAMTRRHFEAIAECIKGPALLGVQSLLLRAHVRETFAVRFADMLAEQNPAFDRGRFLRACGVSE